MNYLELLHLAAPEAVLTIAALVVLALGLTSRRNSAASPLVTVIGLVATAAAIVWLPKRAFFADGMLVISPLNSFFQLVGLTTAFFTVLLTRSERAMRNRSEYLALLLFAALGLMLLISSEELLMIFIGLELLGLSLYVLTAFDRSSGCGAEAGLKYFLFGSTASAFTLFGLSFIYGMTGATSLAAIAQTLGTQTITPLLFAGIVMTLIGFAFKIAAAPFHLWAPDTYEGAPISTAAFIASGSKVASFVVLGKIVLAGFGAKTGNAAWHAMALGWTPILAALAAFSILIGNLAALVQKNVRRLLAYSAVAHAGYTLLGLVAGGRDGFSATLFYTTIYAFTLIGAFGVVAFVRQQTGGDEIANFAGLRARLPWLAGCMAIFLLSLAGLPPLAGFFGKFYLFGATMRGSANDGLLWLVALALFGSLISLYYYLIVLKAIFLEKPERADSVWRFDFPQRAAIFLLAALVLFLGVLPNVLLARILAAL